jgi:hypothetical protein
MMRQARRVIIGLVLQASATLAGQVILVGTLTTKNLLIAGEGGVHTNAAGRRVAGLRAHDKATGADAGAVEMPNRQTGSPMTYQIDGKPFIVVAVGGHEGAEPLAFALP